MDGLLQDVRKEAWDGLIPAEFSMDSSEVTSLQRPLPLYLLLPRMGFLPCVADAISHHFGEVAPDAQRTLWLEETRSGKPLRWHIPTGVLFDLIAGGEEKEGDEGIASLDGGSRYGGAPFSGTGVLPWRITVHFQGCPRRQVFPLEKEADMRRHYTNALKQALFLQTGSSRAGMTLAKENQNRLWQALKSNDPKVYHEMDAFLGRDGAAVLLVPVRMLTGEAPPSQLPIPAKRPDGSPFTLRDCLCWFCPDVPWESPHGAERSQHAREDTVGNPPTTGGDSAVAGAEVAPSLATAQSTEGEGGASENDVYIVGRGAKGAEGGGQEGSSADFRGQGEGTMVGGRGEAVGLPTVTVQGVDVPLDSPILQLWGALRHPDHFLYIVVRQR